MPVTEETRRDNSAVAAIKAADAAGLAKNEAMHAVAHCSAEARKSRIHG
eukprot:COSAG01_NODE_12154_length_1792_cov_1.564087_1_plen_48_part_10